VAPDTGLALPGGCCEASPVLLEKPACGLPGEEGAELSRAGTRAKCGCERYPRLRGLGGGARNQVLRSEELSAWVPRLARESEVLGLHDALACLLLAHELLQ
jgi:hypothetical protein